MFEYKWNLSKLKEVKPNGLTCFGTFLCAGGSSMGYKLAGYHHLGGVEIDPRCAELYKKNLNPEHLYVEDLRIFNERTNLPDIFYNLDLLDGSPPCSSFSTAGLREKAWGKSKVFREGQSNQTLDDLVFIYTQTILKLRPKVAVLENVTGLIKGAAKGYLAEILNRLKVGGYDCQVFSLNAASMGVPQRRQRVFIVAKRIDLKLPKLVLNFNEPEIPYKEFLTVLKSGKEHTQAFKLLQVAKYGEKCVQDVKLRKGTGVGNFSHIFCYIKNPLPTITSGGSFLCFETKDYIPDCDLITAGSFPQDYNFMGQKVQYYIGMSVPPLMTAHLSNQIAVQLFGK